MSFLVRMALNASGRTGWRDLFLTDLIRFLQSLVLHFYLFMTPDAGFVKGVFEIRYGNIRIRQIRFGFLGRLYLVMAVGCRAAFYFLLTLPRVMTDFTVRGEMPVMGKFHR